MHFLGRIKIIIRTRPKNELSNLSDSYLYIGQIANCVRKEWLAALWLRAASYTCTQGYCGAVIKDRGKQGVHLCNESVSSLSLLRGNGRKDCVPAYFKALDGQRKGILIRSTLRWRRCAVYQVTLTAPINYSAFMSPCAGDLLWRYF